MALDAFDAAACALDQAYSQLERARAAYVLEDRSLLIQSLSCLGSLASSAADELLAHGIEAASPNAPARGLHHAQPGPEAASSLTFPELTL